MPAVYVTLDRRIVVCGAGVGDIEHYVKVVLGSKHLPNDTRIRREDVWVYVVLSETGENKISVRWEVHAREGRTKEWLYAATAALAASLGDILGTHSPAFPTTEICVDGFLISDSGIVTANAQGTYAIPQ